MVSINDYGKKEEELNSNQIDKKEEVGTVTSILAGIGSGLFKIPEGIASLGATLIDLGADTNKAAEVEEWFAKINPFDEAAAATTAGKITELITNIAIPGGVAFKIGSGAVKAARGGKYLNLSGNAGKNIQKGINNTLTKSKKIKAFDESATSLEKAASFAAGAGAGGVAEGIFVGDVEEAGTFGDLIGGPTELERDLEGQTYDPVREILNRVKFGAEGALFTGAIGSAGAAIKKLRSTANAGKAADNSFLEFIRKSISPRGKISESAFPITKEIEGMQAADLNAAMNFVQDLDGLTAGLFPYYKRLIGDKVVDAERKTLLKKMNRLITSGEGKSTSKLVQGGKETLEEFQIRKEEFRNIKPEIKTEYLKKLTVEGEEVYTKQLDKITNQEINKILKQYNIVLPEKIANRVGKVRSFELKELTQPQQDAVRIAQKIIRERFEKTPPFTKTGFVDQIFTKKDPKQLNLLEEEIKSVSLGPMNKELKKEFLDDVLKLQSKGVLKSSKQGDILRQDVSDMFATLDLARMKLGSLSEVIGKRLDTAGTRNFKKLFERKISTWLDRSYDALRNPTGQILDNYIPAKQAISSAKLGLQKLYQLATGGKETILTNGEAIITGGKQLSESDLQQTIKNIIGTVRREKGFQLANKGDPYFQVPDFFVGKSSAKEVFTLNNSVKMSELTGIQREVMESIMGKNKDVLQTIIEATQSLSTFARGNQLKDELLKTDQLLKSEGRIGIFADTPTEAIKQFARKGQTLTDKVDYGQVGQGVSGDTKGIGAGRGAENMRGPAIDPLQSLKPIGDEPPGSFFNKKTGRTESMPILDPIAQKYTLQGNIDGIFKPLEDMSRNRSLPVKLYQNLILYPKATSQMAKTILSPFTHARNFISAGAFAMANGMIPFADREAVRRALNALQTPLMNTRKNIKAGTNIKRLKNETDKEFKMRKENYLEGNEFYQKLLKLGVVNSQVQLGDLRNLLGDVQFGGLTGNIAQNLDNYGLNRMLKFLSKAKKTSEDLYTAEDDFWKIFSFIGEGNRLRNSYRSAGLSGAQEFHDLAGARRIKQLIDDGMSRKQAEELVPKVRLDEDFLDREAASIIKNNIPNYAYVGDFVKALRKLPFGNFVSFPAEIIRTGTNVVERGLDEIFYQTTINGKLVNPLRTVGLRRLTGMAFTTAAVPAGVVAGASAIYNVTEEERAALKNYVASWSKNSTLVPIRDEKTGKLSVIDFSHSNAYDTLSRPIQTILNKVAAGEGDRDGLMDDFFAGMIEATKELGSPFISESIWTEALADLYFRGGETREGFRVWKEKDNLGTQFQKGIAHLAQAQAPLNWKQLERLGLSMKPIDDIGRIDDNGKQYQLGNEALGIIGFRAQEIDPNKSIKYKIATYNRDARNSKALFTNEILRGGVTTPKEIVDAYINANRELVKTQKVLNKDIRDAITLNANESELSKSLVDGIGKKSYGKISNNIFTPVNISKDVIRGLQQITEEIQKTNPNFKNPFYDAIGAISNIQSQLFNVDLENDEGIPEIENPFDNLPEPTLGPAANVGPLPTLVTATNPAVMVANQQIVGGMGSNPKLQQQLQRSSIYDALIPPK
jgi:hypothetical protein